VESSSHELDLRGLHCPLTWARARVYLEGLARGCEVALVVDDPQSARDVPRAAEATGHHVIGVEACGAAWRIRLEV
jgi:TusA-related sulfurtransferase